MKVVFSKKAKSDMEYWEKHKPLVKKRVESLISNIKKTPYTGIGKPEPLKHELRGLWARRIDKCHRLIYAIASSEKIEIRSCKGHYS